MTRMMTNIEMEEMIAETLEADFNRSFCGDCGEELTKENMWSEYTCKECAERLRLDDSDDTN